MKRYIGNQVIKAKPMTRLAYNQLRGWALPADENGADAGYLVEYTDGGKPNLEGYAGYVSWSPAEQFEWAYRERPAIDGLQLHQQRVVDEKADLEVKAKALSQFIGHNPVFEKLDEEEKELLKLQNDVMFQYYEILAARIAAF
jgi:hypothetical protein